jgi:hypothetical protein
MGAAKTLQIVGGATLLYYALNSLAGVAYDSVEVSTGTPVVNYLGGANNTIAVKLPVSIQNWNYAGVTVESFVGTITYGQLEIGTVYIPMPTRIPARGVGHFNLEFDIQGTNVLTDALNALFGPDANVRNALINKINLKGLLKTNLVNIPIDQPIPIV